jgi:uncharacterized BrkB/YihY/UPF0761 family membrane protein
VPRLIDLAKQVIEQSLEDDVSGLAAELGFRFFLAMFPFFVFLGALGGFIAFWLQVPDPTQRILVVLGETLPPGAADLIRQELEAVLGHRHPGSCLSASWPRSGSPRAAPTRSSRR